MANTKKKPSMPRKSIRKWTEFNASHYQLWCKWERMYVGWPIRPFHDFTTKNHQLFYSRVYPIWMGRDKTNKEMPSIFIRYIGTKEPPKPNSIIVKVRGYIRTYVCFDRELQRNKSGVAFFMMSFSQAEDLQQNTYDMARDWKDDYEEVTQGKEVDNGQQQ